MRLLQRCLEELLRLPLPHKPTFYSNVMLNSILFYHFLLMTLLTTGMLPARAAEHEAQKFIRLRQGYGGNLGNLADTHALTAILNAIRSLQ